MINYTFKGKLMHWCLMIHKKQNCPKSEYQITIKGVTCRVEPEIVLGSNRGLSIHGKWASYTGYQHVFTQCSTYQEIYDYCVTHYDENQKLPFIVGDEHKEHGWKKIDIEGEFYFIRIPAWTSTQITDLLITVGFELKCPVESKWKFKLKVEKSQIESLLQPLLLPGTRMMNQDELYIKLLHSYDKSLIKFNQSQLGLFETSSSKEPPSIMKKNESSYPDRMPLKPGQLDLASFDILVSMTRINSRPVINALRDIMVHGHKQITAATVHDVNPGKLNTTYHNLLDRYNTTIDFFESLYEAGTMPAHLIAKQYIPSSNDLQVTQSAIKLAEATTEEDISGLDVQEHTGRLRSLYDKLNSAT